MKKNILYIIIGLICLSLAGIIGVQYFWIRNALKVKAAQFDRSVNDAMGIAVGKLETREDITYIRNNMEGDSMHSLVQAFSSDTIIALNNKLDSLLSADELMNIPPPPPPPPKADNNNMVRFEYHIQSDNGHFDSVILVPGSGYSIDYPNNSGFSMEWKEDLDIKLDSLFLREGIVFPDPAIFNNYTYNEDLLKYMYPSTPLNPLPEKNQSPHRTDKKRKLFNGEMSREVPPKVVFHQQMHDLTLKAKKIKDVIRKIATEIETKPQPIEKRIDRNALEKSLKKALTDKGVEIPFEYAVLSPSNDTNPIPFQSAGFTKKNLETTHRISLFPNDIFQKPELLLVHFPAEKTQILKSVSLLMMSSVFFTIIIAISSILSIFIMLRQKRISDIKTDFINNMTHEFKTPIATISIAVDSINNPKVIAMPDRIMDYTRIIREENMRMNSRVEQVLQMALLDSRDFMLKPKITDIHAILSKVTSNIRLQVESRGGTLTVNLQAEHTQVNADEVHLSNVFVNLLDNANKYSPEKPDIIISTRNSGSSILIDVSDKGIGMDADTRGRIFEKFFRVNTGNIHNVKGFGLGLSYAKAIVLSHKGEINVFSEQGRGSRFEVRLPLADSEIMR